MLSSKPGLVQTLCGVDLDNCLDGDALAPWARVVLDRLGAYAEVSPSGRGVEAFWFCTAARF